jgi:pimeloyl-ACP methyl ester carboxylesterase
MNTLRSLMLATSLSATALSSAIANDLQTSTPDRTPTVVMVHGAFADGSSWNKVIPLLQAKGLKAIAVQNPLTSLEDDVAAAKRVIDAQTGPVILVGHSWAGTVITQVGGHDKVEALVYVAAFAPALGETSGTVPQQHPTPPGFAKFISSPDGYLTLPPAAIASDFAQDVSAEEANLIAATQGPVRAANFEQTVTFAAWTDTPSWYVVAGEDRMIHPEAQRALASRIGAKTTELSTGHVPMASDPQAVADVIIDAARSISK